MQNEIRKYRRTSAMLYILVLEMQSVQAKSQQKKTKSNGKFWPLFSVSFFFWLFSPFVCCAIFSFLVEAYITYLFANN